MLQSFSQFASEAASWQASRLTDRRAYTQARIEAARAIDLYPQNGYALFRLAAGDFAAGSAPVQRTKALESLQKALTVMPHQPYVLALTGESLYSLESFDESAQIMDQLFRMRPAPNNHAAYISLVRASAHFRGNNHGEAVVPIAAAAQYPENRAALAAPQLLNSIALNQPLSAEAAAGQLLFTGDHHRIGWKLIQELFAKAEAGGKSAMLVSTLQNAFRNHEASGSKLRIQLDLKTGRRQNAAAMANALRAAAPQDPDMSLIGNELRGNGLESQ